MSLLRGTRDQTGNFIQRVFGSCKEGSEGITMSLYNDNSVFIRQFGVVKNSTLLHLIILNLKQLQIYKTQIGTILSSFFLYFYDLGNIQDFCCVIFYFSNWEAGHLVVKSCPVSRKKLFCKCRPLNIKSWMSFCYFLVREEP